jgi:hypothetical protein
MGGFVRGSDFQVVKFKNKVVEGIFRVINDRSARHVDSFHHADTAWVNRDQDKARSRARHVLCAPKSGSEIRGLASALWWAFVG